MGTCRRERSQFVITISQELDQEMALEVLLHEWAHALSWSLTLDKLSRAPDTTQEAFDAACHDATWGCSYARVYRLFAVLVRTADSDGRG